MYLSDEVLHNPKPFLMLSLLPPHDGILLAHHPFFELQHPLVGHVTAPSRRYMEVLYRFWFNSVFFKPTPLLPLAPVINTFFFLSSQ